MNKNEFDFFKEIIVKKEENKHIFSFKIFFCLVLMLCFSAASIFGIMKYKNNSSEEELLKNTVVQEEIDLLGDNNHTIESELKKHNIKSLDLVKLRDRYEVNALFNDNKKIMAEYAYFGQGYIDSLRYDFNFKFVNKADGLKMVFTDKHKTILKENIDKNLVDKEIVPEMMYLIRRAGYTYIWEMVPEYSEASFSKEKLDKFNKDFPDWATKVGPEMLSFVMSRLNSNGSVLYIDEKKSISLANMFKAKNIKPKEKEVCKIVKSINDLNIRGSYKNTAKEFVEIVNDKSINDLVKSCN